MPLRDVQFKCRATPQNKLSKADAVQLAPLFGLVLKSEFFPKCSVFLTRASTLVDSSSSSFFFRFIQRGKGEELCFGFAGGECNVCG